MSPRQPKGYWYLPGLLYDLAFKRMFRGLRRRVVRTVEREWLYPWLDVCCGTGDQMRRWANEPAGGRPGAEGRGEPEDVTPGRSPTEELARTSDVDRIGAGREVYGLDIGFPFVRYAWARAPHIPFICGDAARLPFKDGCMRAISISFGLHDKSQELRSAILAEAKRVLKPEGRLIAVDFENPWDAASRAGALFTRAVELFAGRTHYGNGREFLRRGGLRGFLRENGFVEVARRDVPIGSLSVVVARVETGGPCELPPAE
jgi:ubiquinone/menaquinone biosynthesis C-methylase UbiE